MKSLRRCDLVNLVFITTAGLLHLAESADVVSGYQRCYNTTEDTHCFDVLYDNTTNRSLTTSFDIARQRCTDIGSTLLIIKDEEFNGIFQQFMSDSNNPIRMQSVWTDAYRFIDFNVTYRWQWLNKALPNLSAYDVFFTPDYTWYVAALEFSVPSFRIRGQQPHFYYSYICEYPVSNCYLINSNNVRQFDDRCYAPINAAINWYEARNLCLRGGGDLASFANVTSINFTSWLGSDSNVLFWIGLRFARYTWIDSGEDVTFSKWYINYGDWYSSCLVVCFAPICNSNFGWFPTSCSTTNTIKVVCHTATTLHPTTTSTSTVTSSSESEILQSYSTLSPHEQSERLSSNHLAVGVGVGVGVGIPITMAVILMAICIFKRSGKLSEPRPRRDNNELATVGKLSVGQVNDSTMDQYQHLDQNLDNTPATAYDKLNIVAEPNYEEFHSNRTQAKSEIIYETNDIHT